MLKSNGLLGNLLSQQVRLAKTIFLSWILPNISAKLWSPLQHRPGVLGAQRTYFIADLFMDDSREITASDAHYTYPDNGSGSGHQRNNHSNKHSRRAQSPGPGSIMYEVGTDILFLPFFLPLNIMDAAHPDVGAAVAEYSVLREDPWGRLGRTLFSHFRQLHGGKGGELGHRESQRLRNLHKHIKGRRPDGKRYSALKPATFRIVPDTILEAVVRFRQMVGAPLSQTEEQQLFEEYYELCLLFGIPDGDIPDNLNAYWQEFNHTLEHVLTHNPTTIYLLEELPQSELPKPPFFPVPQALWNYAVDKFLRPLTRLTFLGLIHPRFRERTGLAWTENDQVNLDRLFRKIRFLYRFVPRIVRTVPIALFIALGGHGPQLSSYEQIEKSRLKRAN